ncbi:MAG TPA: AbrB/MazE/SpoVT family DNA-binding domain-containing protein [Conexibacter sp.]|nr:AbrB/MazE/SpoVT family DNA-binding domain-containing protein [Conexibacter sp.]
MPKLWRSGHIVIPKAMREAHGLHPGTEVEFEERDGSIVIRKVTGSAKASGNNR